MRTGEAQLVDRARQGDTEAFSRLVKMHSSTLFRLAYRLTSNEATAEDVVQEAFIRAYQKLDRFDGRAAFGTWLYRIAVNCSMDAMRKKRRSRETADLDPLLTEEPPALDPGPQRLVMSREISEEVERVLSRMSRMERTAFLLKHCEGKSLKEIAEIMDLRVNAVKHAIFRAVRRLREELSPLVRGNYETA